jgi:hypothetical protein
MSEDYSTFIRNKSQLDFNHGFKPTWIPDFLFDFQKYLVDWAIRKGRSAIFTDCGTGKSIMSLVIAENIIRHTNKPALILTPLAVSYQIIKEAEKFGIEAYRSVDGKPKKNITVTNYEKLHYFDRNDYSFVVCDEAGCIKNFASRRKEQVNEFLRMVPFRLLGTATAAPNDYLELGNSSEVLGYLGFQDMITRFFRQETAKGHLAWGRSKYRFKGHAAEPFWQWVCSWARSCRKPSDLGFSDEGFDLMPLIEKEHVILSSTPRNGMLVALPAKDRLEILEERRVTLHERCEAAALHALAHNGQTALWAHLNPEADLLEDILPDALQVSGSMSDELKEERLLAFASGELKQLITKPKIAAFGLNLQNCHNVTTFPDDSYESHYQLVRRFWRYGQPYPVTVNMITTQGEEKVLANLKRKARQADEMFSALVKFMSEEMNIERDAEFIKEEVMPSWL